jgi:Flp pilus assembly protein TadB
MEDRIERIEQELQTIKARNQKVEAGKAWEQSAFRLFSIAFITYVIASVVLYFIHVPNFYLSALVPVIGYLLSVQSLPFIKDWWIKRYSERQTRK